MPATHFGAASAPASLSTFPVLPFKDRVRHEWDAVAEDWGSDRWWTVVERSAQTCNERLVELAGLEPGDRALDVGTGVGEPAATAARRVGPEGRVLGVDLAPRMIEEGRKRIRKLGLANVDLELGDVESLALEPGSFDAVLSRWTLMMMEDLGAALADLLRLLAPGGTLAAGLWGHPSRVPMIQTALGAALDLLQIPAPPPDAPSHLWTQGTDVLERLARNAGFTDVRTESVELVFEMPSREDYAEFIYRMAGPVRVLVDQQPEPTAKALLRAIAAASRPFERADGSVRFGNETILLVGRCPSRPAGSAREAPPVPA